jgi:hypothetical protein
MLSGLLIQTTVGTTAGFGARRKWADGSASRSVRGIPLGCEQTVHGADGAVMLSFIEQGGIDRGGRAILKAFLVEISQDGVPFRRSQGASRPDLGRGAIWTWEELERQSR